MCRRYGLSAVLIALLFTIECGPAPRSKAPSPQSPEPTGDSSSDQIGNAENPSSESSDVLFARIADLSGQIYDTMVEQKSNKVAILPLSTIDGAQSVLGVFLADKLTNSLFAFRDRFEVVDRMHLSSVLQEMRLSLTGLVDPGTAQELGKILGADAIVAGTLTDLQSEVDVTLRVLGTEGGNVLAVASVILPRDDLVANLLGQKIVSPDTNSRPAPFKRDSSRSTSDATSANWVPGLQGSYYDNFNWRDGTWPVHATFSRIDRVINFGWGKGSPAGRVAGNNFGAVWQGEIRSAGTGMHSFLLSHDDGARLTVNGERIIDLWRPTVSNSRGQIYLEKDRWYPVTIEYFEVTGGAHLKLKWAPPGQPDLQIVPSEFLRCVAPAP